MGDPYPKLKSKSHHKFLQEMNEKDDREDEDEYRQDSDDEDWKPSPVKVLFSLL